MLSKVVEKGQKVKKAVSVRCKTHNQINKVLLLGALSFKKSDLWFACVMERKDFQNCIWKEKGCCYPKKIYSVH